MYYVAMFPLFFDILMIATIDIRLSLSLEEGLQDAPG
jgi:hypothetical protein